MSLLDPVAPGQLQHQRLVERGLGCEVERIETLDLRIAQQQKRPQSRTRHRQARLREKLDDQLGMVQALIDGEVYTRMRRMWRTDENGRRVLVERPRRTRPWYWMSGAGGCYFQVW
jgi:hypothetical protein